MRRRIFPFMALYELLLFITPLVWSFAKEPWGTVAGWVAMGFVTVASVLPMLVWNYNLQVRYRGFPREMSWEDIQGDFKFIQGL